MKWNEIKDKKPALEQWVLIYMPNNIIPYGIGYIDLLSDDEPGIYRWWIYGQGYEDLELFPYWRALPKFPKKD